MTTQSSTPFNGRPMTFACNFETFISMFDTETDAIDHILLASDDGRVETTQHTIPYYTYNRLAQPPRFISYACSTQIHHYEVRINASKCSDNDVVIEFPMGDTKAIDWFSNHLFQRLSDGWGDLESHEMNITNPDDLECRALALQREINLNGIQQRRDYIIENNERMAPEQFERNCRDIVETTEENKAITERIEHLNYTNEDRRLA